MKEKDTLEENKTVEVLEEEKIEKSDVEEVKEEISELNLEESIEIKEVHTEPTPPTPDELIEQAKEMVEKSEKETVECINNLDGDISHYEEIKSDLIHNYIAPSQKLLGRYDFKGNIEIDENRAIIDLDNAPTVEPIYVSELSSGKVSGFILGLISAFGVIFGWIYLASKALSIKLSPDSIPSADAQNKILSWIGGGNTGGVGDPLMGTVILAVSGLIILWIVYSLKVYLQAENNIKKADEVTQEVIFYCTKKEECKLEMGKISDHINMMTSAMKTAMIYLDEQNASLRRIKHIEGEVDFDNLHTTSQDKIRDTKILVIGIEELISTDMSAEDGTLSKDAETILEQTIKRHHNYKEKIYS
jgi:hypothetical protein